MTEQPLSLIGLPVAKEALKEAHHRMELTAAMQEGTRSLLEARNFKDIEGNPQFQAIQAKLVEDTCAYEKAMAKVSALNALLASKKEALGRTWGVKTPERIQTIEEAFLYLLDCQLGTLQELESRKRVSKRDLARHQAIAVQGTQFADHLGLDWMANGRALEFIESLEKAVPTHPLREPIESVSEAFRYLMNCLLATVEGLEIRSRVSKSELRRHRSIAVSAIHYAERFGVNWQNGTLGSRVLEFAKYAMPAKEEGLEWAQKFPTFPLVPTFPQK